MLKLILFASMLSTSWSAQAHLNDDLCEASLVSEFVPDENKLDRNKSYFKSSTGRFMRFIRYERDSAAIRQSDFLHVTIHGIGDRAESFQEYHTQWARAGYDSLSIGLHGSDLDILRQEKQARGQIRAVYQFEHQVQDIVELLLSQKPERIAISSHSAGVPISLAVARDLKKRGIDVAVIAGGPFLNFRTAVERAINPDAFRKMAKDAVMNPLKLKERIEGMLKFFLTTALRDHFEKIAILKGNPLPKEDKDLLGLGATSIAMGLKPIDLMDKSDPMGIRSSLQGSSLMVLTGEKDKVVHPSSTRRFGREMKAAGLWVESKVLPETEHDLFEIPALTTFPTAHDFFVESFARPIYKVAPIRNLLKYFQRGG